jgi:hypothetical protein
MVFILFVKDSMFGKKPLEQNGFFEFLLPLSRI